MDINKHLLRLCLGHSSFAKCQLPWSGVSALPYIFPAWEGVWKWTPYVSRIDVKFDVKVLRKLKIGLFLPISNMQSANFHTRPGWKMSEWFALILLKSIPYILKGGRLKMDTMWFKEWRQIWRQSRKKLKIGLFSPISNKQSTNFHTRLGWEMTEWFALILLECIPYTLKKGAFENGHHMIRGLSSNLTSKS